MLLVENSPATILIAALAAASQGVYPPDLTDWSLWNSRMPNDGDQAIAIYDTGSKPDGRSHRSGRTVEHPSLQIRIRSADYPITFQKALSLSPGSTLAKSDLGYAYAKAGRREDALRVLDDLQRSQGQRRASPFHLALVYIGLGENDRAIELLQKAYNERAERLVWIRADARFDTLRQDPRFIDILIGMGLARGPVI